MHLILKASLATAMVLAATAPGAYANGISISTDRVQVRVGESGRVQINTSANRPVILNAEADHPLARPSTQLTPRISNGLCSPRSQSSHRQTQRSTPSGNRIYTESYSTTRLCQ